MFQGTDEIFVAVIKAAQMTIKRLGLKYNTIFLGSFAGNKFGGFQLRINQASTRLRNWDQTFLYRPAVRKTDSHREK